MTGHERRDGPARMIRRRRGLMRLKLNLEPLEDDLVFAVVPYLRKGAENALVQEVEL